MNKGDIVMVYNTATGMPWRSAIYYSTVVDDCGKYYLATLPGKPHAYTWTHCMTPDEFGAKFEAFACKLNELKNDVREMLKWHDMLTTFSVDESQRDVYETCIAIRRKVEGQL